MRSVNKAILIGNVGSDPEIRYTQKGDAIMSFSLATSEKYNGNETVQWHRVSIFGKLASALAEYIVKGTPLYVEGQIRYEDWIDKDGNKRSTTKINVGFGGNVIMLGGKKDGERKNVAHPGSERTVVETTSGPVPVGGTDGDDIPF